MMFVAEDEAQRLARQKLHEGIARDILRLRERAGLTQAALADLAFVAASTVSSRLENTDYQGHSLAVLLRVAAALGKRLVITFADPEGTHDAP